MRDKQWNIGILAATVGIVLTGTHIGAQTTAGQARPAQAAAAQTRGAPSRPAPASTPQTSSPASSPPQAAAAPTARPPAPFAGAPRRDPFRPIIVKRTGDELPIRLPPGKPGLVIGQLTVQGIVRGLNGEWIAVVDNKTKRAYFLYERDELFNGVVARITEESVIFEERVTDAAGRTRTREVVKRLNPE